MSITEKSVTKDMNDKQIIYWITIYMADICWKGEGDFPGDFRMCP